MEMTIKNVFISFYENKGITKFHVSLYKSDDDSKPFAVPYDVRMCLKKKGINPTEFCTYLYQQVLYTAKIINKMQHKFTQINAKFKNFGTAVFNQIKALAKNIADEFLKVSKLPLNQAI